MVLFYTIVIPVRLESSKCRQKKVLKKRAQIALKITFERRYGLNIYSVL